MHDFTYDIPCINSLASYNEVIEAYNWIVDSFSSLDIDIQGINGVIDFDSNGISYNGASIEEFKTEAFGSDVKILSFTFWTKSDHAYLNYHVSQRKTGTTGILLARDKNLLIKAVDMLNYKKSNMSVNKSSVSFVSLPSISEAETNLLLSDIYRSLENNAPELVLDRLHTFAMRFLKGFCHIHNLDVLDNRGNSLPLQSLLGKIKSHILSLSIIESDFTKTALSANISIIDKYNFARNQESFAHDNNVMNKIEAKYAVKTIANILVLISELDGLIKSRGEQNDSQV